MQILTKFALAAMMLITTLTAQAGGVRGYYRSSGTYVAPYYRSDSGSLGRSYGSSSGYVYRNPYAAYPSVHARGYYRRTGTYVAPHVRTAPKPRPTQSRKRPRTMRPARIPIYGLTRNRNRKYSALRPFR